MTNSDKIPLGGPAALTTSGSGYLPGRAKYGSTLCSRLKHNLVSSQQCKRPVVMRRTSAVIFWLLTAALPDNGAIRWPEGQNHGEVRLDLDIPGGPNGQDCVADSLPLDPSVWNQATPGATKWYEDQDCGGEGLALDLPLWQKGRLITEVPVTHTSLTHITSTDPHPFLLYTVLIIFDRVMYVKSPTEPWVHFTTTWSLILLNTPAASAADTGKISLYDCGATSSSQPLVQQFNLNMPDPCSNASSVYLPPQTGQTIQVLQIPSFSPLTVHNCLIETSVAVGYCGFSGFTHMAHAMRTISSTLIYPSSVECLHAINKGIMKFSFPPFGSTQRTRLSIPLTKGKATFEQFLTGYSTIDSDCLSKPFTAPDGEYVAKAIVRLSGTITVRSYDAKLIHDPAEGKPSWTNPVFIKRHPGPCVFDFECME